MSEWSVKQASLMTEWAKDVDITNPWPEYPRPQFERAEWLNLNGFWEYSILSRKMQSSDHFEGQILVPFCIESALSGVMKKLSPNERLWYRRSFSLPEKWALDKNHRVILHFGAVDWECTAWLNGVNLGSHKGGYTAFCFDITEALNAKSLHEIVVAVWDPTDKGRQEHGKQVLHPFGINYTPISGIWQTVWLEYVSKTRIESCKIVPQVDSQSVSIQFTGIDLQGNEELEITVSEKGKPIVSYDNIFVEKIVLNIPNPRLWGPGHPFLYDIILNLKRNGTVLDSIKSYFGMRCVDVHKDPQGQMRIYVNHETLFQYGSLDQGYWPDGLYTPPTDAALKYDLEMELKLGFNMVRKHIKVEPARWYYHCDQLGILVWQDMPSGGSQMAGVFSNFVFQQKISLTYGRNEPTVQKQYFSELTDMINMLYNSPSIIIWVPFNEGWGQFQTEKAVEVIRQLDQTRLVNNASGWKDMGVGDVIDIHAYPGPKIPNPDGKRAVVCGEFGGLGYQIPGHTWQIKFKWGYRKFTNLEEIQAMYTKLIEELKKLEAQGMSAAVYTQITDVEGEINGLITYDREIVKFPIDWMYNLNRNIEKKK